MLNEYLAGRLREARHEKVDFGNGRPKAHADYQDSIVPLPRAFAGWDLERVAIRGRALIFGGDVLPGSIVGLRPHSAAGAAALM